MSGIKTSSLNKADNETTLACLGPNVNKLIDSGSANHNRHIRRHARC
jgi:hypothetical protein